MEQMVQEGIKPVTNGKDILIKVPVGTTIMDSEKENHIQGFSKKK